MTATVHSILVPLDGSPLSEQALVVAAALAKHARCSVHLSAVEPPAPVGAPEREDLRRYLASKADALATTHGVRSTCALLQGRPAAALADYAEDQNIDLVVMTSHGRSGLSRFWLGSVADQLLRRVAPPVLLLRPGAASPPTRFYRVLVALDETESESVMASSLALGGLDRGTHFVLGHVVPLPPAAITQPGREPWDLAEPEREAAHARLERLARRMREDGLAVSVRVVAGEKVGGRILELARAEQCDLIVVGTHSARRGDERLALGSAADKVVRGATRPVLVVPAGLGRRRRATGGRATARTRRRTTRRRQGTGSRS